LDGVLSTRAGWLGDGEVVEVRFDPDRTSFAALARAARAGGEIPLVYALNPEQERVGRELFGDGLRPRGELPIRWVDDQEYYLRRGRLGRLPLLEVQATRMNAEAQEADRLRHLSPRQRDLLERMDAFPEVEWPDRAGEDFPRAWRQIEARLARLEQEGDR